MFSFGLIAFKVTLPEKPKGIELGVERGFSFNVRGVMGPANRRSGVMHNKKNGTLSDKIGSFLMRSEYT